MSTEWGKEKTSQRVKKPSFALSVYGTIQYRIGTSTVGEKKLPIPAACPRQLLCRGRQFESHPCTSCYEGARQVELEFLRLLPIFRPKELVRAMVTFENVQGYKRHLSDTPDSEVRYTSGGVDFHFALKMTLLPTSHDTDGA